jgi:chitin disaccharide deacetylase
VKPKRLIINADDYGWSRGITDGILHAHQAGVVTSTSLMANQPASEYAIEKLQNAPNLGVGIHLNLCDGRPVLPPTQVPSLVRSDGTFFPAPQMAARLKKLRVSPREIEKEFRAQIAWVQTKGITPTHADSHHHMHFYPCAVRAFRRAVEAGGIRCARAPRREYWPKNGQIGGPYGGPVYRRLLMMAYVQWLQQVVLRNLTLPDSCFVDHPRCRVNLDLLRAGWMEALANVPAGTYELGCHPGLSEAGFSESDSFSARRELELRILTDLGFRSVIDGSEIELITYRELVDQPKAIGVQHEVTYE